MFTITLTAYKNSHNLTLGIFKLSTYKYLHDLTFDIRFLTEQLQTPMLIVVSKADIVRLGSNVTLYVAFRYVLLRVLETALSITLRLVHLDSHGICSVFCRGGVQTALK